MEQIFLVAYLKCILTNTTGYLKKKIIHSDLYGLGGVFSPFVTNMVLNFKQHKTILDIKLCLLDLVQHTFIYSVSVPVFLGEKKVPGPPPTKLACF